MKVLTMPDETAFVAPESTYDAPRRYLRKTRIEHKLNQ